MANSVKSAYTPPAGTFSENLEELEGYLALTLLQAKVDYKTAEQIFKAFAEVVKAHPQSEWEDSREALLKGKIFANGKIYNQ